MIGQFKIHGRLTALKLERKRCYVVQFPAPVCTVTNFASDACSVAAI
jgi:hypothetical protein